MKKMTSRERIIAAINHQPTDILPIDFGAMRSTGISIEAYARLRDKLGFTDGLPKMYDVFQQLAEPEMEIVNRLGGDVVQAHRLSPAFGFPIRRWREDTLPSGTRCMVPEDYNPVRKADGTQEIQDKTGKVIARMPSNGLYFDGVDFPLANAETMEDVEAFEFEPMSNEEVDFIEAEVKYLYEQTDKAILLAFGGNILEAGESYWGFEKFFEYLLIEPELIHYWLNKLTEAYLRDLEKLMPRVAPYIQILQCGDDLGTQESSIISPKTYREMIKPYHKRIYSYVKENWPQVKIFLHSCGAISELIPDLIDAGVDILNPVQISAKGMIPEELKNKFGKQIVFWGGGANMQHTVLRGSLEEIKKEVRGLIEIFSKDSGYVFNQVHNIQANVEPDKILAIYDTALEYRKSQNGVLEH